VAEVFNAIQGRIAAGTIRVYSSMGGNVFARTSESGLAQIDARCPGSRFTQWVMAFAWERFGVVLKKSHADAVCMILAGRATPAVPGDHSEREVLDALETSPLLATVVEFMAFRQEPRYEGLMAGVWGELTKFANERGLYWRNGKSFPGGPSTLSRQLNANASMLLRCSIKYETSRKKGRGANAVLSRLPDDVDDADEMPSAMPSAHNPNPEPVFDPALTTERKLIEFRERQARRASNVGNPPVSTISQGESHHEHQ